MTTAGNGGRHNLFKFVPNSWILDRTDGPSFADFMRNELFKWQHGIRFTEEKLQDIILNNWNTRLIPTVFIVDPVSGETNFIPYYANYSAASIKDVPLFLRETNIENKDNVFSPRFIKIKRSNATQSDSQRQYSVYKRISTDNETGESVYALVDPKGGHYDDKNDIWEYCRNDSDTKQNVESLGILKQDTALT
jgi:hypothetical protein